MEIFKFKSANKCHFEPFFYIQRSIDTYHRNLRYLKFGMQTISCRVYSYSNFGLTQTNGTKNWGGVLNN